MRGKWITELQVMRTCTTHADENVTRAVADLVGYEVTLEKMCLNEGVEFKERISNGRLFQTVGPVKSRKIFL